ncbi:fungal-specific transcription factor domain-containing protein [Dactylonectria macrodidyma]|uniref:Fungal-specific transcription factor domain-containing protein n=1 Tax=Dactylonectria macrodidyma TaxID=307937 RepID=A0A9P9JI86_9HYPO|nr:fungal-specific transcription factor domain-containing protein [Dactylonectria macrodidyma]
MPSQNDQVSKAPRKRVTLACNGCRAKRTKCDGGQPRCSACNYRQQDCEYSQAESNRRRHSNAYIMALEARVATLERQLASQPQTSAPPAGPKYCNHCNKEDTSAISSESPSDRNSHGDIEADQIDDLTDALGCFTLGDTGELRFFGASSNFTIIQNHSIKVASSVEARNRGIAAARQLEGFFDPSDELRDHLLGLYWKWQNSWQYIVPRESFVEDLYVEKTGRFCTPLLLTAMFALASRYSSRPELRTDPDNPNTAGDVFAAQAKVMLHCEYEAPTTSTAQATALLGLFWACIDKEGLGFMYIGMASRMAMNLGLHSDCSSFAAKGLIPEEDVEARNVTFWGIYVLDKLYCLGMGRPASIQEYNITTTKPKGHIRPSSFLSQYQAQISQPWPTPHITENCSYLCELLIATSEAIDQLYAQRYTWTEREREERVMKAHLEATTLFDRLPKSLKISNSSLQPSPPYVYQLHLQYHHAILLLHRPFFQLLYPGKNSIEYDPDGKDVHSRSCYDSAVKTSRILQICRNNFTSRYIPISAVHPAFTAAIILLLHVKSVGQSRRSDAMRHFTICIKALYEMNINWDWANRSIRAIQSLASQWEVDIWAYGLANEISEESRQQFETYESGGLLISQWPVLGDESEQVYSAETYRDIFEALNYDCDLMNLPLNIFNENW